MGSVNLHEQFVTDICTLLLAHQKKGHDIVLMMVVNEAAGAESAVDHIMQ
jgi:hypothetical protein